MAKKSTTLLMPIINSNEAKYVPEGAEDPGQTHGPYYDATLPACTSGRRKSFTSPFRRHV